MTCRRHRTIEPGPASRWDQAPAYAVFSSTDLGNAFTNNGASISILTNVAPAGYQAASVTQPVSGSKIFYRIKATLPQEN